MNVGATSETDYGDYFMWGSTIPNNDTPCYWEHTPFNNGLDSYNEEYFTTHKSEWLDDNNNLKPEYDAARAIMGGDWRMPTEAEFQEFLDNTTHEWTPVNGVYGIKFTSKTDTSKYIFFPPSGYRFRSSFQYQGRYSHVWSSSLSPTFEYALNLYSASLVGRTEGGNRYLAFAVRGVL